MGASVNPSYPYKSPADLISTPPQRKPLIGIGSGTVGLALEWEVHRGLGTAWVSGRLAGPETGSGGL